MRPLRLERFGLSANRLGGVEGLGEALTTQVVVPHFGESLVLRMEVGKLHVLAAHDVPAPLLHAYVVVAVVLCEAPDYVKWNGRRQSGPM